MDSYSLNSYQRYFNNPDNRELWPDGLNQSESKIKEFLSRLGSVKKIQKPCENSIVVDFEIEGKNIFVEVKSINTVYGEELNETQTTINIKNENEWLEKINLELKDIEKKRQSLPKDSTYVGILYIETVQIQLGFGKCILDPKFVKKTNFMQSNLDGLLIYPEPAGGNIKNQPPGLYSKIQSLMELFSKNYETSELRTIFLNRN